VVPVCRLLEVVVVVGGGVLLGEEPRAGAGREALDEGGEVVALADGVGLAAGVGGRGGEAVEAEVLGPVRRLVEVDGVEGLVVRAPAPGVEVARARGGGGGR